MAVSRILIQSAFAICLALCLGTGSLAQTPPAPVTSGPADAATPAALEPGAPAGSYSLAGFEHINRFNGHLSISLPLVNIGGRGNAGFTCTRW
jgi:hypothetical protein